MSDISATGYAYVLQESSGLFLSKYRAGIITTAKRATYARFFPRRQQAEEFIRRNQLNARGYTWVPRKIRI